MRLAIATILTVLTASSAEANWGWHHGPRYYAPAVYYPPVYFVPYYGMPYEYLPFWCECPPAVAATPVTPQPAVPVAPPKAMPAKSPKTGSAASESVPYSPIVPASGAEETIPKPQTPLPKVTPAPMAPPKVDIKPAESVKPESPKIELPPITPSAPKLELPPLPVPEKTTSKYGSVLDVKMTAVSGTPAGGQYEIAFRNYTDHEVEVMVDGSRITLPSRHTTTARVGMNYRWSLDGGSVSFGAIPAGHRGAEVSIR